jgi:protein-S-isoprenylcysteine O-methyltransferase Ste14
MTAAETAQPQHQQQVPDVIVRLGGWLFRRRTAIPLPIVAALLLVPAGRFGGTHLIWLGAAIVGAGELLRLSAVRHIGAISRTRSDRLGPLVATGPFGWVRNPLYVGNLLLWIGFTVSAHLLWLLAPIVALLLFEYHAIVRWEETLLESRLGEVYRAYMARVPRWIPTGAQVPTENPDSAMTVGDGRFSWSETFFSERGTLVAILLGYIALWIKSGLMSGSW